MFFAGLKHLTKLAYVTEKGKTLKSASAKAAYHYLTRTGQFSRQKSGEIIEFVEHGNLPAWAQTEPAKFWKAADTYEREKGRVATTLAIALPNHISTEQRVELAQALIQELCHQYQFPYAAAIHRHPGALSDIDQPHLHIMYSERGLDGIQRSAEQFFKQWNRKAPERGGTRKLTADVLGYGRDHVNVFREIVERQINQILNTYAPTKIIEIKGEKIEVPSLVSRLSTAEYNKRHGTALREVPMIPAHLRYSKDPEKIKMLEELKATIEANRAFNLEELYSTYYKAHMRSKKPKLVHVEPKDIPEHNPRRGVDHQSYEKVSLFTAQFLNWSKGIYDEASHFTLRDELLANNQAVQDYKAYREVLTEQKLAREQAFRDVLRYRTRIAHSMLQQKSLDDYQTLKELVLELIALMQSGLFDRAEKFTQLHQVQQHLQSQFDVTTGHYHVLDQILEEVIDDCVKGQARLLYGLEKNPQQKTERPVDQDPSLDF